MSITYEWQLTGPCVQEDDSIKIFWKKIGTHVNGKVQEFPGQLIATLAQLVENGISDIVNSTSEQILNFVKSKVGIEFENFIDSEIEKQIQRL
jgi:hypothetical protein